MSKPNNLHIFPDLDSLSTTALALVVDLANQAVAENGRFIMALSGGSTPKALFQKLRYSDEMPWAQTYIFWGDERLVPPDDVVGSSYGMTHNILLQHVPIPPDQVFRAKGEMDSETAVADYKQQLKAIAEPNRDWPRFDLALMGMGSDGHTASLFPGASHPAEETEPVIAVKASYDGRPAQRISLTPMVFNDARNVLFLAVGENKAEALTAVLNHHNTPQKWPAQRIRPHNGQTVWFVDQAAANLLSGD